MIYELFSRKVVWTILALAAATISLIVLQGFLAGTQRLLLPFDFVISGQFGESFGPVTAFMSALAAIGAWSAVVLQRRELAIAGEQREKDEEERADRAFDAHYYQLLQNLDGIVGGIDHVSQTMNGPETKRGKDAIKLFREQICLRLKTRDTANWEDIYKNWFLENADDFGHYFRFLYHIVSFVDHRSGNSVQPMAFLRAKLSDSELVLIALNCTLGFGKGRFRWLVEKYHLFHNMTDSARREMGFEESIAIRAFAPGMTGKFLGARMEAKMLRDGGENFLRYCNDDQDHLYISHSVLSRLLAQKLKDGEIDQAEFDLRMQKAEEQFVT